MTPEEAVLQLELIGHDFFVFRNAESNEVNVVYRRSDGDYGLIEPQECRWRAAARAARRGPASRGAAYEPRRLGRAGIHGVPRPREWDAVVTVDGAGRAGDASQFVALADGDARGRGRRRPATCAARRRRRASVAPPYRALAVRRDGAWAVGASRIEVVELPDVEARARALPSSDGARELTSTASGLRRAAGARAARRGARARATSVAARERLDGTPLVEVRVDRTL